MKKSKKKLKLKKDIKRKGKKEKREKKKQKKRAKRFVSTLTKDEIEWVFSPERPSTILEPITIEKVRSDLKRSERQLKEGKGLTLEDTIKLFNERFES